MFDESALHYGILMASAVIWFTLLNDIKAKLWEISSDTHQLQLIKLHHFKQERFKSI